MLACAPMSERGVLPSYVLAILGIGVAGCPAPDPQGGLPQVPLQQALDYNEFVCGVQPVLVKRCSYLACHGNPDHAFRVYSPGKLRLLGAETRAKRSAPLSTDEVSRNFESASSVHRGLNAINLPAAAYSERPPLRDRVPFLQICR